MVVDYRNPILYHNDTARFKRDMQGGMNTNPGANQFWVIYKSLTGFTTLKARIYYFDFSNVLASSDRVFFISTDNMNKEPVTQFNESGDVRVPGSPFFYRDYEFSRFPEHTYFFEFHFSNWTNMGSINYWTPQIAQVFYEEVGDSVCGNGICEPTDSFGSL